MTFFQKLGICFTLCALAMNVQASCISSIPSTSPTTRFIDNNNGTITDVRTGLMWMRCSLGQTWTGTACTGTAAQYAWADALAQAQASVYASHTDWRLPNVKELVSIVERQCAYPSINSEIFPATPTWYYWTSSPNVSGSGTYVQTVEFSQGTDGADDKAPLNAMWNYHVRLVRTVR